MAEIKLKAYKKGIFSRISIFDRLTDFFSLQQSSAWKNSTAGLILVHLQ